MKKYIKKILILSELQRVRKSLEEDLDKENYKFGSKDMHLGAIIAFESLEIAINTGLYDVKRKKKR